MEAVEVQSDGYPDSQSWEGKLQCHPTSPCAYPAGSPVLPRQCPNQSHFYVADIGCIHLSVRLSAFSLALQEMEIPLCVVPRFISTL